SLRCLIESGVLNKDAAILQTLELAQPLKKTAAAVTPFTELLPTYREAKVPDHRALAPALHALVGKSVAAGAALTVSQATELTKLKVDLSAAVAALAATQADTNFEQVTCVGLETAGDTLGAVIHVKQPFGYSGDQCHDGSKEYVAFWADWNND